MLNAGDKSQTAVYQKYTGMRRARSPDDVTCCPIHPALLSPTSSWMRDLHRDFCSPCFQSGDSAKAFSDTNESSAFLVDIAKFRPARPLCTLCRSLGHKDWVWGSLEGIQLLITLEIRLAQAEEMIRNRLLFNPLLAGVRDTLP